MGARISLRAFARGFSGICAGSLTIRLSRRSGFQNWPTDPCNRQSFIRICGYMQFRLWTASALSGQKRWTPHESSGQIRSRCGDYPESADYFAGARSPDAGNSPPL